MLLSVIWMNDCTISKSAGDTKLERTVDSFKGQEALHRDLDRLKHWTVVIGTKFNMKK